MNAFINQYLTTIKIVLSIFLLLSIGAVAWIMNGWRLGKQVSDKQVIIERLTADIRVLNERNQSLGREQLQASAVAEKAQKEAASLRVSVNEKTRQIMALKASSCAAVIESQWGKQ